MDNRPHIITADELKQLSREMLTNLMLDVDNEFKRRDIQGEPKEYYGEIVRPEKVIREVLVIMKQRAR